MLQATKSSNAHNSPETQTKETARGTGCLIGIICLSTMGCFVGMFWGWLLYWDNLLEDHICDDLGLLLGDVANLYACSLMNLLRTFTISFMNNLGVDHYHGMGRKVPFWEMWETSGEEPVVDAETDMSTNQGSRHEPITCTPFEFDEYAVHSAPFATRAIRPRTPPHSFTSVPRP